MDEPNEGCGLTDGAGRVAAANHVAAAFCVADAPAISVVVPARDEEGAIGALLDALVAQTRAPAEIVVADGGSRDGTAAIVELYARRDARVRLVRAGAAYPGRGRNVAAARASCDWLAFVDAGTRPAADWLARLAAEVERDPSLEVVLGAWEPVVRNLFDECSAISYAYAVPVEVGGVWMPPPCVGSSLVRRAAWSAVGGFREDLRSGEDLLFMDALDARGLRTAYAPRALVSWEMPPTLARTFRRFLTYSRHNLRAGLWRRWHAAILTRYALLLLCALAARLFAGVAVALALLVALLLAMLAARGVVALWRNRKTFPAGRARNALRLALLVPLTATVDAATLAGALHWLVADKLRLKGTMKEERGTMK
ncbi:MAG: glycosyltransferase [Acidobacteria bacterium]|nr:glycosyltransferase [Acidobacteriota bacterium]